jgi:hypothetical protein
VDSGYFKVSDAAPCLVFEREILGSIIDVEPGYCN